MAVDSMLNFKVFLSDINLNKFDRNYLIFLFCLSIFLTVVMIRFNQVKGGFNGDIYRYLTGVLSLAGIDNGIADSQWIQNSPVIIFLTSLLFRLGFIDITSIFIVTGLFGIFGILGMYTFLRVRFSPLLSFMGTILYSSLSLTLYYFANGMLDIPAVSMIIWTLIFTVVAVDKNPKYYILVAISFSISFFIRYTSAYILILIVLYMFKNHDVINLIECLFCDLTTFKDRIYNFIKSPEFKCIIFSMSIGIIIFLYVFQALIWGGIDLIYFGMAKWSTNSYSNSVDANYITDTFFYIKNFLNILSCNSITFNNVNVEEFNNPTFFSYLIIILLFSGILLNFINFIKNLNFFRIYKKAIEFRSKNSRIFLISSTYFLLILAFFGFKVNYIITLICLFLIFIILMSLVEEYPINKNYFNFSILCFALFIFYFVIFSFVTLKCVRYILPAFPAFIYFFVYSINYIMKFLSKGFDDENSLFENFNKKNRITDEITNSNLRNKLINLIPIILIIMSLFFMFNFTSTVADHEDNLSKLALCDFIKKYDPNYQSKEFYYDLRDFRNFEWYLNKEINQVGFNVNEFNPNDYDYIIVFGDSVEYNNFRKICHIRNYYLYEQMT